MESRFQRLIDSNIIGVAIEDIHGKIIDANDVFLKIIGYSRKELAKLSWIKITNPQYRESDINSMKILFEKGEIFPYEKEYLRKDKQRIFVLKGGALLDDNPPTAVVFVVDITPQKLLEQRKDEFISIASHELKTPLTSIKAFTQLLERHSRKVKDKRAVNYLARMESQLDRLTKLVIDLLDVTKIQEGKLALNKEAFNFDQLVSEMIEEAQTTNPDYNIVKQGDSQLKILADKFRISQVVTNLLNNAIKYSTNSRKIIVTVADNQSDVLLTIQDFGIGIAKDHHPEIFKKFYRVDSPENRSYPGLGLGLYITSEIIKRHHGKIWVDSHQGRGSVFSISLPSINHG